MPRDHQRGQQALAGQVRAPVRTAWDRLVDVQNLNGTLPAFKVAAAAVVVHYGSASGAAALRYYRTARLQAGVTGRPTLALPPPVESGRLDASIDWATRGLWTPSITGQLIDAALSMVEVSAERMVLNQGRDTLMHAVSKDPQATGWARVAEGNACAFCAMLTSAGAHYKSEESSGFEAHDNCACSVEPVFDDNYVPPADVQDWQQIYAESTSGLNGDDAINAFRRAYERPQDQ